MRTLKHFVPVVLFGAAVAMQACGSVKIEDEQPGPNGAGGGREYPVKGVIRGTVFYQGPRPCSANGHIVGNVPVLVFDARNPPPPSGLANTATNLTVVSGDALFANEPRSPGAEYCPSGNVTVTAGFAIGPLDAGEYYIQAFYDRAGNFLPTFKFRNLPQAGDIGGGYIDTNDATSLIDDPNSTASVKPKVQKQSNANYQPIYLPIKVGDEGAVPADSVRGIPTFTMPKDGVLVDNVTVAVALNLDRGRPYFYPEAVAPDATTAPVVAGEEAAIDPPQADKPASAPTVTGANPDGNVDYAPILTISQDYQIYAQPTSPALAANQNVIDQIQASFPQIKLHAGVPDAEFDTAASTTDPKLPFHFQMKRDTVGVNVWTNGPHAAFGGDPSEDEIPETRIPRLWPLVVLAKLKADPKHTADPQSLAAQGSDLAEPIVIIQGITIAHDSLYETVTNKPANFPSKDNLQDHVTVLVRPSALCLDPRHVDRGGVLVTPHLTGPYPPFVTSDHSSDHPLVDQATLRGSTQLKPLLRSDNPLLTGCLPTGRYGINMVYPTGQAWTTPNETGSCATVEGKNSATSDPGSCSTQVRPVLYSQGNRAVVEVVASPNCGAAIPAVPTECTTLPSQ